MTLIVDFLPLANSLHSIIADRAVQNVIGPLSLAG